ncbi:MAG TPA: retroviral-like aspartic protease family protein [Planctomycetaceae bacterium]|nr:retroviral-like aspartic protease family protein [Planctomycetaceae bacterium]
MGTFYTACEVEHIVERHVSAAFQNVMVDSGSELTWLPAKTLEALGITREKNDVPFMMANGQQVTRSSGFAIIRVGDAYTVDEVVFAESGDLSLLGARTLEGLNLMIDPARKRLVAAGPLPAA